MKAAIGSFWRDVKAAASGISADKVPMMGAALSYYTAFSIAPLLVIALGVAGMVFGDEAGTAIYDSVGGMVGKEGAGAIRSMVESRANAKQAGAVATAIGFATLLLGASGVFIQLQESLNVIWKVAKKPGAGWMSTIRQRLLSFGMVGAIAFLLLVSLLASAAVAAVSGGGTGALWEALNAVLSIAVTTGLFAAIFKVLPDVRLAWRDVLVGGLFTAVLFTIGKTALGAYIGRSDVASSYGAAGSLIVVLLWVFYSSQLVLFGAEYTRAYATRGGREVEPKADATVTVSAFGAAAAGKKAVQHPSAAPPPAARSVAAAAAIAAGSFLLKQEAKRPGRRGTAALFGGGLLVGGGSALLALLELPKLMKDAEAAGRGEGAPEDEEPSALARLIGRIPTRVKVAAVVGALKGGGGEALRELKDAARERLFRRRS